MQGIRVGGLIGAMTDSARRPLRLDGPARWLAAALTLMAVLSVLPSRWLAPARDAVRRALEPGQRVAAAARLAAGGAAGRVAAHVDSARRLADAEADRRRLAEETARLAAEVTALRAALAESAARRGDGEDPLGAGRTRLGVRALGARVLGRQARAYLARRELLDVGGRLGLEPDTLVADAVPLLDLGAGAGVRPGQLVAQGHCLWGKVAEVGARLSTLQRATESGFRDVVELLDPDRPRAARRPRGLLEGTGEPLARVRWIDVTEPVAEGDLVCSAALEGVVGEPLVYGRVVRAEQPVGAGCWEIWMEPVLRGVPDEVCLLVVEPAASLASPRRAAMPDAADSAADSATAVDRRPLDAATTDSIPRAAAAPPPTPQRR